MLGLKVILISRILIRQNATKVNSQHWKKICLHPRQGIKYKSDVNHFESQQEIICVCAMEKLNIYWFFLSTLPSPNLTTEWAQTEAAQKFRNLVTEEFKMHIKMHKKKIHWLYLGSALSWLPSVVTPPTTTKTDFPVRTTTKTSIKTQQRTRESSKLLEDKVLFTVIFHQKYMLIFLTVQRLSFRAIFLDSLSR